MKRKVLGRGLGALIPDVETSGAPPNEIDIDRISPNPYQPRLRMDEKALEELAASIREHGVIQPVVVRPFEDGYQLIAGERRLSAAQRAGFLKIPAVIRDVPEDRLLELALIENIQREQLNPMEEAQAYQSLLETLRLSQEELAGRLGKERSTVANSLRLLKLPPPVKLLVAEGKLSAGHARALLSSGVPSNIVTRQATLMVEQGWSVRDAERWAKQQGQPKPEPRPADPNEVAAAEKLRRLFGTKVEILGQPNGSGQVRIHYYSTEDLDRIYSLLVEKRS
jgi:ParB family transcriptional regulator, chromosome partitioning protein